MAHIPFVKLMATMAPCLFKETILSKLSNFVHTFNVDVTQTPFGDTQRKYINTVMKLNNSKTLMLETTGEEVVVQNTKEFTLKEGQTITIEFSKLRENDTDTIFVNYQYLDDVPVEAHIGFKGSAVMLEVVESEDGILSCVVKNKGIIPPEKNITFEKYKLKLSFLSEIDKKNVSRGLQSGINLIAASAVKQANDIISIREFLDDNHGEGVKVLMRLHTKEAFQNFTDVVKASDGVIFSPGIMERLGVDMVADDKALFEEIKKYGKPITLCLDKHSYPKYSNNLQKFLQEYADLGVDSIMVSEDVSAPEFLQDEIVKVHEHMQKLQVNTHYLDREVEFGQWAIGHEHVQNYIIHKAYKTAYELPVKTIVCYTETGNSIAKLTSLRNIIPLVVFTKSDPVYRYINTLRGVKGYKISQSFDYSSFKRIGKEMIRILFKGSISLEDKVLIMQIREEGVNDEERISDMVNGIELYKFKNM